MDHLMQENRQLKDENIRIAIEAQERERREIGQDMHDELGSTLLTMKMNLGLIEKQGLFIFASNDALKELKYALESAIEYVRSVSRITSPAFLENFGLSRAIVQMVKRINSSCVAKVEFTEIAPVSQLEIPCPYSWAIMPLSNPESKVPVLCRLAITVPSAN
jgi:signal transduction histidine kinase